MYQRPKQMFSMDRGSTTASSLLKGPGQVLLDFNSHFHRLTSAASRGLIYCWREGAEGWERAALRYAKVIHDGICQLCKWLPFSPLPRLVYQPKEPVTESLLNSDCLPVRMISVLRAAFCAATRLD